MDGEVYEDIVLVIQIGSDKAVCSFVKINVPAVRISILSRRLADLFPYLALRCLTVYRPGNGNSTGFGRGAKANLTKIVIGRGLFIHGLLCGILVGKMPAPRRRTMLGGAAEIARHSIQVVVAANDFNK